MSIAILYTHVTDLPRYSEAAQRFHETYQKFKPKIPHDLIICQNDHRPSPPDIGAQFHYQGQAKDCGAYLSAGPHINADWVLCCNSHVYFHRDGWLERLAQVASEHGDKAMYGLTASYEVSPHLRTTCMMVHPYDLNWYAQEHCLSRPEHANAMECGEWNFTEWMSHRGNFTWLVTWDHIRLRPEWRQIENGFRQGDQSQCLAFDRHTQIFAEADEQEKVRLSRLADGL